MYNSVNLIGRLTTDPEVNTTESGKKVLSISLAVHRDYKNVNGIYETDFIRCVLWDGVANRTAEYCHKGDLVSVHGQIRTASYLNEQEEKKYITEILVNKIGFLVTKSDNSKEDDENK